LELWIKHCQHIRQKGHSVEQQRESKDKMIYTKLQSIGI